MRVSFTSTYRSAALDVARTAEALARAQRQVSSGRRLNSPSDDPVAAQVGIAERAAIASVDRYIRSVDTAASRLAVVDSVLADMAAQLTAAAEAGAAAQGSQLTPEKREAYALRLESIRDALVADLNAQFRGTYIFSGASSSTAPYVLNPDGTVSAYQGDSQVLEIDVSDDRTAQITFDGQAVAKGADASDVFGVLNGMIAAVRSGDAAAVRAGLDGLSRAQDRVAEAQGQLGSDLATMERQRSFLTQTRIASLNRLSRGEDADMPAAISDMARAEVAYRAALGVSARLGQLSLLDYLR